jgi:hypothetical protein
MHIILTAFCVIALALIFWAGCRYHYDYQQEQKQTLERHRNKFFDTPEL